MPMHVLLICILSTYVVWLSESCLLQIDIWPDPSSDWGRSIWCCMLCSNWKRLNGVEDCFYSWKNAKYLQENFAFLYLWLSSRSKCRGVKNWNFGPTLIFRRKKSQPRVVKWRHSVVWHNRWSIENQWLVSSPGILCLSSACQETGTHMHRYKVP